MDYAHLLPKFSHPLKDDLDTRGQNSVCVHACQCVSCVCARQCVSCVCVCVCMHVCVHFVCVSVSVCMHVSVCLVCVSVCMHVSACLVCVCVCLCLYIGMCTLKCVCIHVCIIYLSQSIHALTLWTRECACDKWLWMHLLLLASPLLSSLYLRWCMGVSLNRKAWHLMTELDLLTASRSGTDVWSRSAVVWPTASGENWTGGSGAGCIHNREE